MKTQDLENETETSPFRCVIVVDESLPVGYSANAAAVIALTVGQRHPLLVGSSFVDSQGMTHPGLVQTGVPILAASREELAGIRQNGLEKGCDVIDFPAIGQQTTNYQVFCEAVSSCPPEDLNYLGVAVIGQRRTVNKIVGRFGLLK